MYRIVDIAQNTPEWEEFRKGKIGSSVAAVIMKESPWETPLSLWEKCVFDKRTPTNRAMQRGKDLEPIARAWINRIWGVNYQATVLQSVEVPDLIASLDGFYELDGKPHILEIKCPGAADHAEAMAGRIPAHYMPQLQHQMNIANVDKMFYLSFVGDDEDNVILLAQRNKEYCKALVREEMAFLQRIVDLVPPEPQENDWVRVEEEELVAKGNRLAELKLLRKEIEAEENSLEIELKGELEHARCKVGNLKAEKVVRKGNIDYSKIDVLKEIDLEPFRKSAISYWRFS